MNPEELLSSIVSHGLSIRQIPLKVVSQHDMRFHKEGNEIVEWDVPCDKPGAPSYEWLRSQNSASFIYDDATRKITRRFTRETTVPKHAGWWMCQTVGDTSSRVEWRKDHAHLAPTLEESVRLFLSSIA